MISKKSVIYRFLSIWWVLINMPPRNTKTKTWKFGRIPPRPVDKE